MPEESVYFTFVETPIFSKRLRDLASPEILEALQAELVENPERWGRSYEVCMARVKAELLIRNLGGERVEASDTFIFT